MSCVMISRRLVGHKRTKGLPRRQTHFGPSLSHLRVFRTKNVYIFQGSSPFLALLFFLTCMLPTFCPPTIWAISLEFYRKLSILAADDFLGACYRKAMTPQKLWTLPFPQYSFTGNFDMSACLWVLPGDLPHKKWALQLERSKS